MTTSSTLLEDHPVRISLPVQWGEMDSYQHVNNVVYFRWFESGRMAYFRAIDFFDNRGIGPILQATSCRFRAPLYFPDDIVVGTRVVDVGNDRFTLAMAIASVATGHVVATGDAVVVAYDYATKAKARLPDDVRARIARLEGHA